MDGVEVEDSGAVGAAEDEGEGSDTILWDGVIWPAAATARIELAATIPNAILNHIRRMAIPS
jgi:hypothetical protein